MWTDQGYCQPVAGVKVPVLREKNLSIVRRVTRHLHGHENLGKTPSQLHICQMNDTNSDGSRALDGSNDPIHTRTPLVSEFGHFPSSDWPNALAKSSEGGSRRVRS